MGTFTITQSNPNAEKIYLYPNYNGYGDCTNWDTNAASNYQAVNEVELDVSDYIYTDSTTYLNELFDKEDPSDDLSGNINYVKLYAVTKSEYTSNNEVSFYLIVAPNESCATYYQSNEKPLTSTWSKKSYVWNTNPSTGSSWTWDDIDNLFIGVRGKNNEPETQELSVTLRPTSMGHEKNLNATPDTRNNWDCVDEVNLDTSDYVYIEDSNMGLDLYGLSTATVGNITSVTVYGKVKHVGSGVGQLYIRTHNSNYSGDAHVLSSNWGLISKTWSTNPNTGLAWTQTEIDNLEAGIKLVSTDDGDSALCSQLYVIVTHEPEVTQTIQVAQCYAEVGYTPASTSCILNKPEEISLNHDRNVKMLNFWNGERVVYDLNRSGKTTVMKGMEYYNSSCANPGDRISCIKDLGKNGATITIEDLDMPCFNGDYKIRSFGWKLISNCPETYEWILELEDTELL